MYGLRSNDGRRTGLARTRIGFMPNSVCVAKMLEKRCSNRLGNEVHHHVGLESGRTRDAQEYPPSLCRAICSGIQEQIEVDRNGEFFIASVDELGEVTSKQLMDIKGATKQVQDGWTRRKTKFG